AGGVGGPRRGAPGLRGGDPEGTPPAPGAAAPGGPPLRLGRARARRRDGLRLRARPRDGLRLPRPPPRDGEVLAAPDLPRDRPPRAVGSVPRRAGPRRDPRAASPRVRPPRPGHRAGEGPPRSPPPRSRGAAAGGDADGPRRVRPHFPVRDRPLH